jgi:hypothetical protein
VVLAEPEERDPAEGRVEVAGELSHRGVVDEPDGSEVDRERQRGIELEEKMVQALCFGEVEGHALERHHRPTGASVSIDGHGQPLDLILDLGSGA